MKEERVQHELVMWMQSRGIYFFSVPNEATKGKGNFAATGMRPGVSDLVVVLPDGRVVFVEVKNEVGQQRPAQKLFEQKVTDLGHQYVVVRSVEELKKVLDSSDNLVVV